MLLFKTKNTLKTHNLQTLKELGKTVFWAKPQFLPDAVTADFHSSCGNIQQRSDFLRQQVHANVGTEHLLLMSQRGIAFVEQL